MVLMSVILFRFLEFLLFDVNFADRVWILIGPNYLITYKNPKYQCCLMYLEILRLLLGDFNC